MFRVKVYAVTGAVLPIVSLGIIFSVYVPFVDCCGKVSVIVFVPLFDTVTGIVFVVGPVSVTCEPVRLMVPPPLSIIATDRVVKGCVKVTPPVRAILVLPLALPTDIPLTAGGAVTELVWAAVRSIVMLPIIGPLF